MRPIYQDPWFTFRFAEDRLIPRFHLEGVPVGWRVSVHKADPAALLRRRGNAQRPGRRAGQAGRHRGKESASWRTRITWKPGPIQPLDQGPLAAMSLAESLKSLGDNSPVLGPLAQVEQILEQGDGTVMFLGL